jgi:hypothetical protein
MRSWEWVGELGRRWTLCSIESSPHQVSSSFCASCSAVQPPPGPCACFHSGLRELARAWHVCAQGLGCGGGDCCFSFHTSEINSWVWVGLFGWEWWSLRSFIVPISLQRYVCSEASCGGVAEESRPYPLDGAGEKGACRAADSSTTTTAGTKLGLQDG